MTIIESIREYLLTCPYLEELASINVDFLPDDPTTYSIEQTPTEPIVKRYLDGATDRQFTFVFACRMYYSDEMMNNISNSGFFEKFQNWLYDNSENDILPQLDDGMTAERIEAISSGYLFDISGNLSNARYQIQCRLLYEKEA